MESLIQKFSIRNEVIGIGFGGSSAAKASDILSDIDIYIFVKKQIPLNTDMKSLKKYLPNMKSEENISAPEMNFIMTK